MGERRGPAGQARSTTAGARSAAKLGAALLLAAALFDAAPLYVGGAGFVLLAAACALWTRSGAAGLRIERRLGASRVMEGAALPVEIRLESARVLPSCAVVDELLAEPARVRGGRRSATLRFEARFERRGRRVLDPPSAVVADPLGLARRAVEGAESAELLVLPRVEPLTFAEDGAGEAGTVTRRTRPGLAALAEVDVDGLRPGREGTPASRIHWPAFARSGQLLERRLRPDGDTRPLVVLDPRGPVAEHVDAAVRAAASLCVHLAELGGCALLLPGDRRPAPLEPGLAGWPHLHVRLALVEAGTAPSLAGLATRRGPVVYVAARPLRRVPRPLLHAPAAGRVLVSPLALEGMPVAFAVAGCVGHELAVRGRRAAA